MKTKIRTSMNCDAIAPYYETLEHVSFGKSLERARFAFLPQTSTSLRAIVCGGGDGRFLTQLLRVNRNVHVDFVDLSPEMIAQAKKRISVMTQVDRERVSFHHADLREFEPLKAGYDLIVTHFFLDCFSDCELSAVVARLSNWGTPHAAWVVSEFRETKGPLGRIWTAAITRTLYAAFRIATGLTVSHLPDYSSAIAAAGYYRKLEINILGGLLHSSLWKFGLPAANSEQDDRVLRAALAPAKIC